MNYRTQPMTFTETKTIAPKNKKPVNLLQVPTKRAVAFRVPPEYKDAVKCLQARVTYLFTLRNKVPPSDRMTHYWQRPLVELLQRVNDTQKVLRATHWLVKNWNKNKYIPQVTTGGALNDKFGMILRAIEREGDSIKPVPREQRAKRIKLKTMETNDTRKQSPFTDELLVCSIPFSLMELSHIPIEVHWELVGEAKRLGINPIDLVDYGWFLVRYTRINGKSPYLPDYGVSGTLFKTWRQSECH